MMELKNVAIGLVVLGILIGFGALILAEVNSQIVDITGADSVADNATDTALEAMDDLAGWLPLIVLVIIAAVIIGYLLYAFQTRGKTSV